MAQCSNLKRGHMATAMAAASSERTKSIAFVALSIALMAVSAWVTVPLGPVPFTLQIFVFTFVLIMLEPKLAMASLIGYLALGAIGVPVFSGMRGGIGVLAGPTGGFLWGYIIGFALAIAVGKLIRPSSSGASIKGFDSRDVVRAFVMAFVYLACAYVCGWFQLMLLMSLTPAEAFASAVAPFIVVDIVKIVAAVFVALAVKRALA